MASWLNILDYIPVVGAVKNVAEAAVAFADGDYRTGASKTAEAAIGGFLDCMTFGAGKMIGTAVVKGIGKEVTKGVTVKATVGIAAAMTRRMATISYMQPSSSSGTRIEQCQNSNRQNSNNFGYIKSTTSREVRVADGEDERPPNDNNRNIPAHQYVYVRYVISREIVNMIREFIELYFDRLGFSFLHMVQSGYITNNMRVFRDFFRSLPQTIVFNIQDMFVGSNVTMLVQVNDFVIFRQRLEDALLGYMMVVYDYENDLLGINEERRDNAKAILRSTVEEMIAGRVFVDEPILQYWVNQTEDIEERRRRQDMFDEALEAIETMLRSLPKYAERWVLEAITAITSFNNDNN